MKRLIFFLLLLSSASIVVNDCFAQPSSILAGLHPRPKVSYFRSGSVKTISPSTIIIIPKNPSGGTSAALGYLQSVLFKATGFTLLPVRGLNVTSD
ncbi:MAG TPA: hypothetical protein VFD13_04610, partial [Candidatus Kapabacteria bacterium]|nr:hypothetical protein [Candidatus Kapabacteria bacterium]